MQLRKIKFLMIGKELCLCTNVPFGLISFRMLIAHLMASLAEFERDLVRERVRSGVAAAKTRGQKFGRQPGQRLKADKS